MSSSTPTSPVTLHQYLCHHCHTTISLNPTTTTLLCPFCHLDFIEQITPILSVSNPSPPHHQSSTPTSKTTIQNLPNITLLENNQLINDLCAVCKDPFVMHNQVKQLPCNHMFHCDCILPWLETHNSCPVCRFRLPVQENGEGRSRDLMMRRYRELFQSWSIVQGVSTTHINVDFTAIQSEEEDDFEDDSVFFRGLGQAENGGGGVYLSVPQEGEWRVGGGVERDNNSGETVSSWSVEDEVEVGSRGSRVNGDGGRL